MTPGLKRGRIGVRRKDVCYTKQGKYLCRFIFKEGYDYRTWEELSCFAEVLVACDKEALRVLAKQYEGVVVEWKERNYV